MESNAINRVCDHLRLMSTGNDTVITDSDNMDFYSLQTSFLANTTVSAQYNRMLATLATMASMIAQL